MYKPQVKELTLHACIMLLRSIHKTDLVSSHDPTLSKETNTTYLTANLNHHFPKSIIECNSAIILPQHMEKAWVIKVCSLLAKLLLDAVNHPLALNAFCNTSFSMSGVNKACATGCRPAFCEGKKPVIAIAGPEPTLSWKCTSALGEHKQLAFLEDGGKASVVGAHKDHAQLALGKQQNLHAVVELLAFTKLEVHRLGMISVTIAPEGVGFYAN